MNGKHITHHPTHTITHWLDGVAVGADDEPNFIELRINNDWPVFEYTDINDRELKFLKSALEKAYEAGRKSLAKDVRCLIGLEK